jgi:hypothetical protein
VGGAPEVGEDEEGDDVRKRVGSWVKLKHPVGFGVQKARIAQEVPTLARGAVVLSWPLGGLRWWNKSDLEACEPPTTVPPS